MGRDEARHQKDPEGKQYPQISAHGESKLQILAHRAIRALLVVRGVVRAPGFLEHEERVDLASVHLELDPDSLCLVVDRPVNQDGEALKSGLRGRETHLIVLALNVLRDAVILRLGVLGRILGCVSETRQCGEPSSRGGRAGDTWKHDECGRGREEGRRDSRRATFASSTSDTCASAPSAEAAHLEALPVPRRNLHACAKC